jgi:hypothetical protein
VTENGLYFARKSHKYNEIRKHQERKGRVVEIKFQLESLMTQWAP